MIYKYEKEHEITYSKTGTDLKLNLIGAMQLAQDIVTKYFQTFGSDNNATSKNDNAVWVLTKARIHFNKYPKWTDIINSSSNITLYKQIRVNTETVFYNKDEISFIIAQESCPMDLTTRKIRKIDTISFPDNMEETKPLLSEPFSKLRFNVDLCNFVCNQKVQSADIDFSKHANNVSYIRFIINSFKSDYWRNKEITDFEIHYINELKEGENISIYTAEQEIGNINILIKNEDDEEIVRAKIDYKNKHS